MRANAPYYFVPALSRWPALGALAMFFFVLGASNWVNDVSWAPYAFALSLLILFSVLIGWFRHVIGESEGGQYSANVDTSFRWSMGWFIFSEVMFFAAFFGALFYAREIAMPWLGDLNNKTFLWPDFTAAWPNTGPAGTIEKFETMGPWPIPTINTALLLTSGLTLTYAHHALIANHRPKVILGLAVTVLLGVLFLICQAYEYHHAYTELNLKLTSGIFGSTFFMLTGFHGFHVTIGAIMLFCIMLRCIKGHFKPDSHFAFEAAAWYWHFVDVVWLGLYIVVYWL
ncbi:MAG TPA: cytochrome c oxidase subunit 3 [Limnobacter sp.]|uniref:cytochrome c oxidase subunit 3 n=1 Tax=Limnobacter sp. TaxID=2003368 RepID=UPI002E31D8FE|nr:cytochrome c oxidase subunit 3 [Limnobacter sp.]HEX5486405.1 cytochrome c oxidase subunit 3 [Limnobacter sp.]